MKRITVRPKVGFKLSDSRFKLQSFNVQRSTCLGRLTHLPSNMGRKTLNRLRVTHALLDPYTRDEYYRLCALLVFPAALHSFLPSR
jgi:hypothetical protein